MIRWLVAVAITLWLVAALCAGVATLALIMSA